MGTRYRDKDGDVWVVLRDGRIRLTSADNPEDDEYAITYRALDALQDAYGPLEKISGPDEDEAGNEAPFMSRAEALSLAQNLVRPGPDADPEATARALIRLARFILPW